MGLRKYDKQWLQELCNDSHSFAEVLEKAGRKQGGGAQKTLRDKIKEFGIDVSHFTGQLWNKNKTSVDDNRIISREIYKIEDIFCKNSNVSRKIIKGYIKRHNLIEYKCKICGCDGNWQGGTISLELHHDDGDSTNNEIENLMYLCPNCHALTETYRGKNKSLNNLKNKYK